MVLRFFLSHPKDRVLDPPPFSKILRSAYASVVSKNIHGQKSTKDEQEDEEEETE
jgi:hypothetical protein